MKKEGFNPNELKNSLTFDVSEHVIETPHFLKTWRQNIVIDFKCNEFFIPELKYMDVYDTSQINKINIRGDQQDTMKEISSNLATSGTGTHVDCINMNY